MNVPRFIVCERTGAWASAIRRQLPEGFRLREVRSLAECVVELREASGSLLGLELTPQNIEAVLELVAGLGRRFPRARALVLADPQLAGYRALSAEAGAIWFTCSPRELQGLRATASKHWSRLPEGRESFAAQVWNELPWDERCGRHVCG